MTITGLDSIGGECPVQGDGNIHLDGEDKPRCWYFRARGEHWSMSVWRPGIGMQTDGLMPNLPTEDEEWFYEEEWPHGEFMAGYIKPDVAIGLAQRALDKFAADKQTPPAVSNRGRQPQIMEES